MDAMSLLLSLTSEESEKKTSGYGTAQAMLLFPFFWSSPLIKLAVHRQDVGNQWPTDSLMRNLSQVICLGLVVPWEIQSYFTAGGLIPCSSDVHAPLLPTRTASLQPQIAWSQSCCIWKWARSIFCTYLETQISFLTCIIIHYIFSSFSPDLSPSQLRGSQQDHDKEQLGKKMPISRYPLTY